MKTANKTSDGVAEWIKIALAATLAFASVSVYGYHDDDDTFSPDYAQFYSSHRDESIPGQNLTNGEIADMVHYGPVEELREYLESEQNNPDKIDPSVFLYMIAGRCQDEFTTTVGLPAHYGDSPTAHFDDPERVKLLISYGADPHKGFLWYGEERTSLEKMESGLPYAMEEIEEYEEKTWWDGWRGAIAWQKRCIANTKEQISIAQNASQYMNTALTGGSGGGTTSTPSISGSVREEGYFGSIAGYSGDGTVFAYAFEFGSRQEARDEALDQCNTKLGADEGSCEVKATFSGSDKCAVIATNYDNNGTTVGIAHGARSKTKIQKEALRECNKDRPDGEGSCRIEVKWCGPDADV